MMGRALRIPHATCGNGPTCGSILAHHPTHVSVVVEQRESTDADPGVADDGYTTGFEILGQLIEIPQDQIGLLRSGQELP
jgi:hypothetical protein